MKNLITVFLLFISFLTAQCQPDKTFNQKVIFNQGIQFGDGTLQTTAAAGNGVVDWSAITNKPLTFPPSTHDHSALYKPIGYVPTWTEITGKPTTFAPAAHDHNTLYKAIGYVPTWTEITGKPATFAPAAHDHNTLYKAIGYVPTWAEITGKPTTFTPSTHAHAWADITGKPEEIDLAAAIPLLDYIPLPKKTTVQINAMVMPAGTIGLVWDSTLGVMKVWNGTTWKIYVTGN